MSDLRADVTEAAHRLIEDDRFVMPWESRFKWCRALLLAFQKRVVEAWGQENDVVVHELVTKLRWIGMCITNEL